MTQKAEISSVIKQTTLAVDRTKRKEVVDSVATKDKSNNKETFPTKVVVRRLPPTLSAEKFMEEVSPLPEHNYFNYVPSGKGLSQHAFSRVVINFKNQEDVFLFREKFDNYVFVDSRGHEYPAIVEFSPYQKIPATSRKVDTRENTIDDDAEYKKFLELLENTEVAPAPTVKDTLEEVEARAKERLSVKSVETPLLSYVKRFRAEKRRIQEKNRDERRQKELERKRLKDEERRQRKEKERKEKEEKVDRKSESKDESASARKSSEKDDSKTHFSRSLESNARSRKDRHGSGKPDRFEKFDLKTSSNKPGMKQSGKSNVPSTNQTSGQPAKAQARVAGKSANDKTEETEEVDKKGERKPGFFKGKERQRPKTSPCTGKTKDLITESSKNSDTSTSVPKDKFRGGKDYKNSTSRTGSGTSKQGTGDLKEKSSSLSLKDSGKDAADDRKEPRSVTPKSKSDNISDTKLERAEKGDTTTSKQEKESELSESTERVKAAKMRKRPEIAIYNPAARAAERRQRTQTNKSPTD